VSVPAAALERNADSGSASVAGGRLSRAGGGVLIGQLQLS